jgi:hypothetical protein
MVASYSSASPNSRRPAARTLGALFAGSAVTLSATVLHGGSPLLAGGEAGSIVEPSASPTVAEPQQLPTASSTASLSGPTQAGPTQAGPTQAGPGQAAPWTPGAAPQWSSPLKDLPVRRAPVQSAPRHGVPAAPNASVAAAPVGSTAGRPAGSRTSSADSPAPRVDAEESASRGNAVFSESPPQATDSRQSGSVDGLLSSILHVTKRVSR